MTSSRTPSVMIRPPTESDGPAFLAAVRRGRSLHGPWVSPPATEKAFTGYLERASSDSHRGFLVIHRRTGGMVGVINLNNLIAGAFRNAFLGYYSFPPYPGQGLMSEGMRLVITHAFRRLRLHRLEANIQPGNHGSIALVRNLGFVLEGFSRRYLKIRGRWKDHERWALLSEDFFPRPDSGTGRRAAPGLEGSTEGSCAGILKPNAGRHE